MKDLTTQTASEIALALVSAYKDALENATWWDERLQRPSPPEDAEDFRRRAHATAERRGEALREVAREVAPWIALMDECRPLFDKSTDNPTEETP